MATAALEQQMLQIEKHLDQFMQCDARSQRYAQAPGIGLITATALSAGVGDLGRFRSGRHFTSWLRITPREHSSGNVRRLGRINKHGDTYLRGLRPASPHLKSIPPQSRNETIQLMANARRSRIESKPITLLAYEAASNDWLSIREFHDGSEPPCSTPKPDTRLQPFRFAQSREISATGKGSPYMKR